jgi:ADP-ribose pyrophosphatase YjhB (NUDIX family)
MKAGPLTKKEFDYIYGKAPRLCADLVIKSKNGVLLTKRDITPWKGFWHFPGGTIRYGESLDKAAYRIGMEEVGLKISVNKILGIIQLFKSDLGKLHAVSIVCLCSVDGGKLRGSWQAKEVGFFKSVPEKTIPEYKKFINENKIL